METLESRRTRTVMFLVLVAIVGLGCATRPAVGESAHDESPAAPDLIVRPVTGDQVRIDWNGVRLTDLVHGVARSTGRVVVYDRRQLEKKPPVSLARAMDVSRSAVFPLAESVLASMQLACVEVSIHTPGNRTAAATRIVPRYEGKRPPPTLPDESPNRWTRLDLPFMVVAGPEPQARTVRRALVELLRSEDHPVATPDPARFARAAPPPFSSPYPRCAR